MARSTYIYFVRTHAGNLLGSFTVKHEAHSWVDRYPGYRRQDLQLSRMRDGDVDEKEEILIDWDDG
ncbi:MAG: hypothetical protein ABFC88_12345 [Thermoguttaceae bacterium]